MTEHDPPPSRLENRHAKDHLVAQAPRRAARPRLRTRPRRRPRRRPGRARRPGGAGRRMEPAGARPLPQERCLVQGAPVRPVPVPAAHPRRPTPRAPAVLPVARGQPLRRRHPPRGGPPHPWLRRQRPPQRADPLRLLPVPRRRGQPRPPLGGRLPSVPYPGDRAGGGRAHSGGHPPGRDRLRRHPPDGAGEHPRRRFTGPQRIRRRARRVPARRPPRHDVLGRSRRAPLRHAHRSGGPRPATRDILILGFTCSPGLRASD
ncbi:hypothetical protein AQF52_0433 [Streptomyces venezuelae]|nr:hypothetical protein AQF52_0433 [Streptomyces venezuelae]CUM43739.1 Basic proline-rich protein precursor [Streptomyces venezuelae]